MQKSSIFRATRAWSVGLAVCAGMLNAADAASTGTQAQLVIPRVTRPPALEDFLHGRPREAEAVIDDFRQYEPGDGTPASRKTTAYLSHDQRNLYVVFVCVDEPAEVRAHMAGRENIDADDTVAINLDTFADRRRAYRFAANPLGIQQDGLFTEGQGLDTTFDAIWRSEGRPTTDGYVVWMAIPFESLRFPQAAVQTWGMALARRIKRQNELSAWPCLTQRIEGLVQQFATVAIREDLSSARNFQFIPYGAFARARYLDRPGARFRGDTEARAGLDTKFVVRDALTLDVTANPDFSQVESDEPQVTVNQRYEVFFPEKRPFFIENAGFFRTPLDLFFSRRIVDPRFGARLTGKLGRWVLGASVMDDRVPGSASAGPNAGRHVPAVIGVARVQRELRTQSTLGLLVAGHEGKGRSNHLLSIDTRLKLRPSWVLSGQFARSQSRQADGVRLSGRSSWLELSHTGRHLVAASRYLDHSPGFRADHGFIPRVDMRKVEQYTRYYWKPARGPLLQIGPDVTMSLVWNHRRQLEDWVLDAAFGADFKGPTGMGCRHVNAFERFGGAGFRKHKTDCGITTSWLSWVEVTAGLGSGTAVNYFPPPGLGPFLVRETSAVAGLTFRPTPRVRFDQTYLHNRARTPVRVFPGGAEAGATVFSNHILRWKLNYQFTRELAARAIVDYHDVKANARLIALERTRRFALDLLLTYMLNPGTALHVGYTNVAENLVLAHAETGPVLERTADLTVGTGRQLFIKLSYLFRF